MPQHFLLSAACRDLCTYQISKMSTDEAFRYLVSIRWGEETQVCPSCGSVNRHYFRASRKQWRCRDCDYCFSVMSGTVFSDHKMTYDKLLFGMSIYISSAKGVSATQLARQLDVQVRTAHVFAGKLRECLLRTRDTSLLGGEVQIDGSHICGKPRKPNRRKKATPEAIAFQIKQQAQKKKGIKAALKGNFNPQNIEKRKKRRIVMAMRSIDPEKGMGAKRTIVSIAMTENERDATALAHRYISPDASTFIMTDECSAYSALSRWWEHHTVVHANEFSSPEGYNENQAESYFSRLKRSEVGTFHRMEPKYLMDYANEMAWREDVRRMSEGQKLKELLEKIFRSGRSRWWRGYFQGHHRKMELLML